MSCRYKEECPSYSGWCEGPKQDFSQCIPFLVNAQIRWQIEAQKHAVAAGELKIALAERLEEIRTQIAVTRQLLLTEDSALDQVMLSWKVEQLNGQAEWLEAVLYGKAGV